MNNKIKIVKGNLIKLALEGEFDVIVHGCNCFCAQKSGLAPQMAKIFRTDKYPLELRYIKDSFGKVHQTNNVGDIDKVGRIEGKHFVVHDENGIISNNDLVVVNGYSQYEPGINSIYPEKPPVNYEALRLIFMKMNRLYKGLHIGLPEIGCGLAGGDINIVKQMMIDEFKDCDITLVEFDGVVINEFPYLIKEK